MNSPMIACRALAAAVILSLSLPGIGRSGAAPSVAGAWQWTTQGQDGQTRESTLLLQQNGEKLTGSVKGPRAETPIQNGKLEGSEISFSTQRETRRGQITLAYKGKVDGNTIKGIITVKTGERSNEREWIAKREGATPAAAAAEIDLSGDWAWTMRRDNGELIEATLRIKREAGQITGAFEREGGDWRLDIRDGKLVGSAFTFLTVIERDGNSMTIKNSAEVTAKSMKGKAEGTRDGEPWTREWEATRK